MFGQSSGPQTAEGQLDTMHRRALALESALLEARGLAWALRRATHEAEDAPTVPESGEARAAAAVLAGLLERRLQAV